MATVIGNIMASNTLNERFDMALYPSFHNGGTVARTIYSEIRLHRFSPKTAQADVYHVHVGPGRSFWRKLSYVERMGARAGNAIFHIHASTLAQTWDEVGESKRARVRGLLAEVGRVVVLSEEWAAYCLENGICGEKKLTVLHNAVTVPEPVERDWTARRVLFMGRVGERKGVDVLLRALPAVLAEFPDARFIMAGDGEIERYRALARELGVEDVCEFPGWVSGEARERLYRGCTIYCLPSRNEGMPMSVLEAMAYGLPAVATPVGGVPQVIKDGVNGYLVPPGDSEALAECIIALLADSDLRSRIGVAGRATIEERFSMAAYGEQLAAIYEEVAR